MEERLIVKVKAVDPLQDNPEMEPPFQIERMQVEENFIAFKNLFIQNPEKSIEDILTSLENQLVE